MTTEATVELSTLNRKQVMEMIRGRIRKQLAKLGDTEEEVAAVLLANACYGVRNECGTCPVAMWLSKTLGITGDIQVLTDYVKVTSAVEQYSVCVDLPDPVKMFVSSFDQRLAHSQLDADELLARNDGWDDAAWSAAWNGMRLDGVS